MKKIASMALACILMINATLPLTSLAISDIIKTDYSIDSRNEDRTNLVRNKPNPGIERLEITPLPGRKLIHADTYYMDGFQNDIFEYNYYLLSTDTKELKLKVTVDRPEHTLSVETTYMNGDRTTQNIIDGEARIGELDFNAEIIKRLDITVGLGENAGIFTYTINIIPSLDNTLDPKIQLVINKTIGMNYAELGVTIKNAHINAFGFSIYSTTSDVKFTDKNGKPFTDINESLKGNRDNYYELEGDTVQLEGMSSDGQRLFITAGVKSERGIIEADEEGLEVYKFRMSAKASATVSDVIQNLSLVAGDINDLNNIEETILTNMLFDYRYSDVKQLITVSTDELIKRYGSEKSTLVYMDIKDLKKLEVYVRHLTSDDLVNFEIINQNNSMETIPSMKLQDGKVYYSLPKGTYSININSKGYLSYNQEGIPIYTDKDTFLRNIILIAGDVDDNGIVDVSDRVELIKAYNNKAKDGVVNISGNEISADFNNDAFVNALDLGELLRNIGRFYK